MNYFVKYYSLSVTDNNIIIFYFRILTNNVQNWANDTSSGGPKEDAKSALNYLSVINAEGCTGLQIEAKGITLEKLPY